MGKLSESKVSKLQLPAGKNEVELHDTENLYLRVRRTTTGLSRGWFFRYRLDGARKKLYLGKYPAISLDSAREIARGHGAELALKKDPAVVKEAAESAMHAQMLADAHGAAPKTFGELFYRWKSDYLAVHRSDGGATLKSLFERYVLVDGMDLLQLIHMRPVHIKNVLDRVHAQGTHRTCGVILSSVRQMMHWAYPFEWVSSDPTLGLKLKSWDGQAVERERTLSEEEITQLSWRLKKSYINERWKRVTLLLLATATRVEETVLMERSHVNLEKRVWTIPVENQKKINSKKAQKPHLVYLSNFALEQINILLEMPGTARYVIPARLRVGIKEIEGPANHKTLTHTVKNLQGRRLEGRRCSDELLLFDGDWWPHDLRRTAASLMQELRVDSVVVDKCQNHTTKDTMMRIYQRAELAAAMREAWEILGVKLEELTSLPDPEPDYNPHEPKALFQDDTSKVPRERRIPILTGVDKSDNSESAKLKSGIVFRKKSINQSLISRKGSA
jgi:integrase